MKCCTCRRDLTQGLDVFSAQQGVIGPRGFVPLGELLLFCKDDCVRDYFSDLNEEARPPDFT